MNSRIRNSLTELFEQTNGHSSHPLDEWLDWIVGRHPGFIHSTIEEVMNRKDLTDEDLPAAYVAFGVTHLYTGSQLFFDVVSGAIFGPTHEPYPTGEVLHNAEQIRQRAHEFVNQVFDQYVEEFKQKRAECEEDVIGPENNSLGLGEEDEDNEDEFDPNDPPMDGPDNPYDSDLEDSDLEEHEWEEVPEDDSDLEGEEWKEK